MRLTTVKLKEMTVEEYNQSVETYSDGIYRFIVKNLRDGEYTHDIVQDTFEKLWINLANVNGDKVKSYLFTTAYHTMIDYLRRRKRIDHHEDIPDFKSADTGHYSDLQEILHHAIGKLPDVQRSVVLLRDYEGYSYEEIGEITGLTESQVKVYIYRARVFLKSYIGSMETVI
ncbi:MAG: RNA polymerase sigma factor [Salinivirgaceae bacterium]|nr:RNA polymerase sigma factor [Salinivirgaceae bacterium]